MRTRPLRIIIALTAALAFASAARRAAGADVSVSVDFAEKLGRQATGLQWGLNVFQGFDPLLAGSPGNATYKTNVERMHPGIIRYHSWESIGDSSTRNGWWVNPTTSDVGWDAPKIARALKDSYAFGPERMMNIPSWPDSMKDASGKLRVDQIDAFAALCAELVKIVNIDNTAGFSYWELPNERDSSALYGNDGAALAAIVVAASRAMKKVDPRIKVGGAAFTQAYVASIGDFVAAAGADIDFISYHSYATGDSSLADAAVWDSASQIGDSTKYVQAILAAKGFPNLPTFHDEYNISWAPPDSKMTNMVGGVFDALAMISLSEAGVTGAMAWNEADGWYGKLDGAWNARPSANVYALFNAYVLGEIVAVSSSERSRVTPFATSNGTSHALVLVHRVEDGSDSVRIELSGATAAASSFVLHQVTNEGASERAVDSGELSAGLSLPPQSVSVLVMAQSTGGGGGGASGDAGAAGAGAAFPAQGGHGGGSDGTTAGAPPLSGGSGGANAGWADAACGGMNTSAGSSSTARPTAGGCTCRMALGRAPVTPLAAGSVLLGFWLACRRDARRRASSVRKARPGRAKARG